VLADRDDVSVGDDAVAWVVRTFPALTNAYGGDTVVTDGVDRRSKVQSATHLKCAALFCFHFSRFTIWKVFGRSAVRFGRLLKGRSSIIGISESG
jgi:hypothetical protein